MRNDRKKDLIKAYKEKKASPGIYALRWGADGGVAASGNLGAEKNGGGFTLGMGAHPNKALQAVWNAQGEAAFAYEIVERVEDKDLTPYLLDAVLKERLRHWREALGAGLAVG